MFIKLRLVLLLCSRRWGAWTLLRQLILDTDASVKNGEERVIAYSSFALAPEQKKYCTTRKELLSKKISNDQELIQSDPISCPQNQKGNN